MTGRTLMGLEAVEEGLAHSVSLVPALGGLQWVSALQVPKVLEWVSQIQAASRSRTLLLALISQSLCVGKHRRDMRLWENTIGEGWEAGLQQLLAQQVPWALVELPLAAAGRHLGGLP